MIVTVIAVMLIMYLLINTVFYNSNSNSVLTSNNSNCNNSYVDYAFTSNNSNCNNSNVEHA